MHDPNNFEALERLGSSMFELGAVYEAFFCFWRALKISPTHPLALTNYGLCLGQLGLPKEGLPYLERAVQRASKTRNLSAAVMALIYNNLGNTLEKLKRYPEALIALTKGLGINPNDQFALYNRGIVLLRLNRPAEAIASLNSALAIRPDDADARYNRAMGLLLLGDLKQGFEDYEARLLTSENVHPNFGLPLTWKWRKDQAFIYGRTLLVHGEQGLGDHIQYLRFLPKLVELGADVRLVAHSALHNMIDIPGVRVLKPGADLINDHEYWTALMSLPYMLGIEREDQIPPPWTPTIGPVVERPYGGDLNIGVCWAGNWQHKNDANRSIALATFAKLFDAPAQFVALGQMRPQDAAEFSRLQDRYTNLHALQDKDLRETAQRIAGMDLIVTVDTSIAHLAASMGKPTWILIPEVNTDWRWQRVREDSPWYPSARLFRQGADARWEPVITRVRNLLGQGEQALAA